MAAQEADNQGVLDIEERLSREAALERFMTPQPLRNQNRQVRLVNERLISLGSAGLTLVYRASSPFMNRQLREEYSATHALRIGREIAEFGQLQECGIAVFTDRTTLARYISDSNEFYETTTHQRDIAEHARLGGWFVTIYGHNRQLGVAGVNLANNGHPDRGIALRGRIHRDPSFRDFLRMQAIENTGQMPPAWNRARSMARMYELSVRDQQTLSLKEIAEFYGVDEDQVWRSFNYMELPSEFRELVEASGTLSYSSAIEFRRLLGIYAEQDIFELAKLSIKDGWSTKRTAEEVAKRVKIRSLPAEIQVLVNGENISAKQTELVYDMHLAGASEYELREFVIWITTADPAPRIDDIRAKVAERRRGSRSGQQDIFSGGYDDEEIAERERRNIALASTRMHVGSTVRRINDGLGTLRSLLDNGFLAGVVGNKPIDSAKEGLNGTLQRNLAALLEEISSSDQAGDNLRQALKLLQSAEAGLDPSLKSEISRIIIGFEELLMAEADTSDQDQRERLAAARARIQASIPERTIEQSLF
ncbi:hypothetical protein KC878_04380 [Candidatus Saccharibacteria bacterium]|nr:hypothetical protein [Candidatus Saccharibacteria bacterium]MCB9821437.1 hypothetical protein [Candidatus Nomurabacteria bacterium]